MSSFALYLIGTLIVVGGVAAGAYLLGVAITWIVIGAVILAGFGVMAAVSKGKRPDLPKPTE